MLKQQRDELKDQLEIARQVAARPTPENLQRLEGLASRMEAKVEFGGGGCVRARARPCVLPAVLRVLVDSQNTTFSPQNECGIRFTFLT